MRTHVGGCHCGRVRFEVTAPQPLELVTCNCSICCMSGFLHVIVAAEQFHLLRGEESLTTYTFNSAVAKHRFCKICGVKSFYVPRSHPDGISVNARCLEGVDIAALSVTPFEGRDWEQGRADYQDP